MRSLGVIRSSPVLSHQSSPRKRARRGTQRKYNASSLLFPALFTILNSIPLTLSCAVLPGRESAARNRREEALYLILVDTRQLASVPSNSARRLPRAACLPVP